MRQAGLKLDVFKFSIFLLNEFFVIISSDFFTFKRAGFGKIYTRGFFSFTSKEKREEVSQIEFISLSQSPFPFYSQMRIFISECAPTTNHLTNI